MAGERLFGATGGEDSVQRALALYGPALERAKSYDPQAHGARCDLCPLRGNTVVPPAPVKNPRLVIVGEGPGRVEERWKSPFLGESGQILNSLIADCQDPSVENPIRREEAFITNAALCRGETDWEKDVAAGCCAPRLLKELETVDQAVPIFALGKPAARAILGVKSIMMARGFVWHTKAVSLAALRQAEREATKNKVGIDRSTDIPRSDLFQLRSAILHGRAAIAKRVVLPMLHPAFIARLQTWQPLLEIDMRRGLAVARGEKVRLWDRGQYKVVSRLAAIHRELGKLDGSVSCDIETDDIDPMTTKIVCVGVSDGKRTVVVHPGGGVERGKRWRRDYGPALQQFFENCREVVFHNGYNFDQIVLKQKAGISFAKVNLEDTLLAQHAFASHLPKRLDQVVSQYVTSSPWKVKHGRRGGDEKGLAPHKMPPAEVCLYNCLMGDVPVVLADGSTRKLHDIVRRRETPEVLSLDGEKIVSRRVVGWTQQRKPGQTWWHLRTEADTRARGLVCTPDHEVYTHRGRVEAQHVREDDELMLPIARFSKSETSALLGTLLGDSSLATSPAHRDLSCPPVAAVSGTNREGSGTAQAKAGAIPAIVLKGVEIRSGYKADARAQRYATAMRPDLARLRPLLYDESGRRRLRPATLDRLGPAGLAWWFADDGCRAGETVRIAACRYPREDLEEARAWFERKFGPVSIYNDGVLGFRKRSGANFCEYIAHELFPCARYKLPKYREWPAYASAIRPSRRPVKSRVVLSQPYEPARETKGERYHAETIYCLTVEGTGNFFTSYGLVANSGDCRLTTRAWRGIQADLEPERKIYEHDKELSVICQQMTMGGIYMDRARRQEVRAAIIQRGREKHAEMKRLLGRNSFDPRKTADVRWALFDRLKAPMLAVTATGLAATSAATLETLKSSETKAGRLAGLILEWRVVDKILGTYINAIKINDETGRVHYTWRPYGTVSGRWACRFQSLPRRGKNPEDRVGECYAAEPGWDYWYFDLSQSEMRAAAYASGDDNFIATCESGDVHAGNASILFPKQAELGWLRSGPECALCKLEGKALERGENIGKGHGIDLCTSPKGNLNLGKEFRDISKNAGFGILYSAEIDTIFEFLRSKGFDIERGEVVAMFDEIHRRYATYYRFCEDNLLACQASGFMRTVILGRIRWIGWYPKPGDVYNFPIQSLIADLMNLRLIELRRRLPKSVKIVAQIHDALVLEARRGKDSRLTGELIKELWAEPVRLSNGRRFVMPIDLKTGERLSEFR